MVTINATARGGRRRAEISSSTRGNGNAGGVTIEAGRLLVDGESNASKTGISSQANKSSKGAAGAVTSVPQG
jgi:hypothetical protein